MPWRSYSGSGRSKSSNYTAPSSNWKNLTGEEADGPEFKDATYYSTTNAKSKFGLSTDNLRTILGYRSSHKHYGGGNNLTLYRERDLLLGPNGRHIVSRCSMYFMRAVQPFVPCCFVHTHIMQSRSNEECGRSPCGCST